MAKIRHFFNQRGYLEVETPIMAQHGITDVYLSNIQAYFRNKPYALQTSPEYHMKRLLAAGSGPIFQLARVFRDDELGRWHNPEFTLLEWYQLDINHHQLLDEVDLLLQTTLNTKPAIRMTYQQAFQTTCDFDPLNTNAQTLRQVAARFGLEDVLPESEQDADPYLFLLMTHVVEPGFSELPYPVAVYDFPISQASLARVEQGTAQRFEVYYRGVELANGFHELTDVHAQCLRFEADLTLRAQLDLPQPIPDPYLLAALTHGLPHCSGVALGLDRLFALTQDLDTINTAMAFNFERA